MQAINVTIINPLFLGVFLGTAIACAIALLTCLVWYESPGRLWTLIGAALYLVGSFLVTMWFNVPRNNTLARLTATAPEATAVWEDYLVTWTRWNHVRTVTALAATVLFMLGAFLN